MTIETVKLINNKNGSIIERKKVDYENNINIWTQRGWSLHDSKAVKAKTEKPVKAVKKVVKKVVKKKKSKK
tara:strand:- start:163 stop:375 length:213 start_codon:yes stop_codon:yes gene_type:complete